MKKISKSDLLFVIAGLVFAGIAAAWYFSQKPEAEPETEYNYPVPEPRKGTMYSPKTIKGG